LENVIQHYPTSVLDENILRGLINKEENDGKELLSILNHKKHHPPPPSSEEMVPIEDLHDTVRDNSFVNNSFVNNSLYNNCNANNSSMANKAAIINTNENNNTVLVHSENIREDTL
jgi:hypothetical protein